MEFAALQKEMITAMKAREKSKKDAISSIVAAVKKVAIDEGHREDIPEELVDRTELKAEYQERYDYIAAYAPKMMSEDEVRAYLNEKFADVLATKNKGQIMKAVMGDLKGKADGKVINQIVAEFCK